MIGRPRGRAVLLTAGLAVIVFGCLAAQAEAFIYWTNDARATIGRANLDGSGVDQSFITGATPHGVAVDGQHVYWTNAARNAIGDDGKGADLPRRRPDASSQRSASS